mmetsp:Transcript_67146/g.151776  ORF Transcript_67146/g.151776 Transcript_67146/m.151776 type:complete len:213 (+) Transcript_67146:169-807(+)
MVMSGAGGRLVPADVGQHQDDEASNEEQYQPGEQVHEQVRGAARDSVDLAVPGQDPAEAEAEAPGDKEDGEEEVEGPEAHEQQVPYQEGPAEAVTAHRSEANLKGAAAPQLDAACHDDEQYPEDLEDPNQEHALAASGVGEDTAPDRPALCQGLLDEALPLVLEGGVCKVAVLLEAHGLAPAVPLLDLISHVVGGLHPPASSKVACGARGVR